MKKNHFLTAVILACVCGLIGVSCSKNSSYNSGSGYTPPASFGADTVIMLNMTFNPSTITVNKGATVVWINKDSYQHTVTSDDGTSFNSGYVAGGAQFTYTANTSGTIKYHCIIHQAMGMVATLIVQ